MFYIFVSNGLLKDNHPERMGPAIWIYLWCLDKMTRIDPKNNLGLVLGGKPIKLSEIAVDLKVSEKTIARGISRLKKEKYLKVIRTPCGLRIAVEKAKKRFTKSVLSRLKSVRSLDKSVRSNIRHIQYDNTDDRRSIKSIGEILGKTQKN